MDQALLSLGVIRISEVTFLANFLSICTHARAYTQLTHKHTHACTNPQAQTQKVQLTSLTILFIQTPLPSILSSSSQFFSHSIPSVPMSNPKSTPNHYLFIISFFFSIFLYRHDFVVLLSISNGSTFL
jgi:hypothetical protein